MNETHILLCNKEIYSVEVGEHEKRGGACGGGGVGIPWAHDRYIVNTTFTIMYYHGNKNMSSIKGHLSLQRSSNILCTVTLRSMQVHSPETKTLDNEYFEI